MRIQLTKISDRQHALAIVRDDGRRESVVCETRSLFMHDLMNYAVEGAAGIDAGFWGRLAQGRTLAEMNDRAGVAPVSALLNPGLTSVDTARGIRASAERHRADDNAESNLGVRPARNLSERSRRRDCGDHPR